MITQLVFLIFLFSSALSYDQVCNHADQSSLLAFAANLTTSSFPPLNWSSVVSCCHWEGVRCDASGKVTDLQLHSRGLEGVISLSIGNLFSLKHLNLSNNNLNGTLGKRFDRLTNLKTLDLSLNSIHGTIPQEMGNLLALEKLNLYMNKLEGPIPPSLLKNCSNLEEIILRFNQLDGDISDLDFSRLVHLKKLDLFSNKFSGTIPTTIYSCKSLVAIRVSNNNLTGQISPRIIELKSLSFLSLSNNLFTNITTTLQVFAKCRNLTFLCMGPNFSGEFLPVHSKFIGANGFSKLRTLNLMSCKFGGPIPKWLSKLKSLCELNLMDNQMTGRIPNWLGTLPNLAFLVLSNNNFSGEFPMQLCKLPALISDTNLEHFRYELPTFLLSKEGSMHSWNSGPSRQVLGLSYNNFNGSIPSEIGNLRNIQVLDLDYNNFSGHIPVGISNLRNLEELLLQGNSLTGELPASLTSLHFLADFNVSYNDLEGPIPVGGQFDTFDESRYQGNPRLCGEPLKNHPCKRAISSQVIWHENDAKRHDRMQHFINGLFVGSAFGFSAVLTVVASYIWFNTPRRVKISFFKKIMYIYTYLIKQD